MRRQHHYHKRFKRTDAEVAGVLNSLNLRRRQQVIGSSLFAGKEELDCFTGLALRAVAEHDNVEQFIADEARLLQRGRDGRQITPADQQVNVAGIPDSAFIDGRHPRCYRVAADHGVGNAGLVQRGRRSQQAFAYLRHGSLHAAEDFRAHADGLGRPA
jgi:hypothetical protein